MLSHFEKNLTRLVEALGIITAAIAAVIGATFASSEWTIALLSTSMLAFWIDCYFHFRSAQRHHLKVDVAISTLIGESSIRTEDDLVNQLLLRSLRSMTFSGSPVDDEIWIKHGAAILSHDGWTPLEKLQYVNDIRETGTITVRPPHVYDLMYLLFQRVNEYWATATEQELRKKASSDFLFLAPIHGPVSVRRIFILKSSDGLKRLSVEYRKALSEQLKNNVELRFLVIGRGEEIANFGVYGSIAVGKLQPSGVNEIRFDLQEVQQARTSFHRLWDRASVVTDSTLGVINSIGPTTTALPDASREHCSP